MNILDSSTILDLDQEVAYINDSGVKSTSTIRKLFPFLKKELYDKVVVFRQGIYLETNGFKIVIFKHTFPMVTEIGMKLMSSYNLDVRFIVSGEYGYSGDWNMSECYFERYGWGTTYNGMTDKQVYDWIYRLKYSLVDNVAAAVNYFD